MHLAVLGTTTLHRLLESAPRLKRHFFDSPRKRAKQSVRAVSRCMLGLS
jgi:hypothetical protein